MLSFASGEKMKKRDTQREREKIKIKIKKERKKRGGVRDFHKKESSFHTRQQKEDEEKVQHMMSE
jgi:hypothetical protein